MSYILNTTFHIHCSLRNALIEWLRNEYIPSAQSSGLLSNPRIARVLGGKAEDAEGASVACQLEADTLFDARRWHDKEGAQLRAEAIRKFGNMNLAFFTTYLQDCE